VPLLAARSNNIREPLWRLLLAEQCNDEARLRLSCLAAAVSPTDTRWSKISNDVARALVRQHPLDLGTLTLEFMSVKTALTSPLIQLFHDPHSDPAAKHAAAGILARLAADQPATLVDLITVAEPDDFRLVLPELNQHSAEAIPEL